MSTSAGIQSGPEPASAAAAADAPQSAVGVISDADVEREVLRLFKAEGNSGLVVTVHGGAGESSSRGDAFRELLNSLAMYGGGIDHNIEIEPPNFEALQKALRVLGDKKVKRRLFERILRTFGSELLDPLAQMLSTGDGSGLLGRMSRLKGNLLNDVERLHLTPETLKILSEDLKKLLSNEYLTMLAEHEERVQKPLVKQLAQEALHLIGATFQSAFQHWSDNATQIAEAVQRRLRGKHKLRESPVLIRERIIEGLEEFLWVETSTELTGALGQLFQQEKYRGVVETPPAVERNLYRQFASTCWEIIQDNC